MCWDLVREIAFAVYDEDEVCIGVETVVDEKSGIVSRVTFFLVVEDVDY